MKRQQNPSKATEGTKTMATERQCWEWDVRARDTLCTSRQPRTHHVGGAMAANDDRMDRCGKTDLKFTFYSISFFLCLLLLLLRFGFGFYFVWRIPNFSFVRSVCGSQCRWLCEAFFHTYTQLTALFHRGIVAVCEVSIGNVWHRLAALT